MIKRENKTKEQIVAEAEQKKEMNKQVALAKKIFETLKGQKTLYDAQTVLNAVAGFTTEAIRVKERNITISELEITLPKVKKMDSVSKNVEELIALLKDEKAQNVSILMRQMGQNLSEMGANKFLKSEMSSIKITDKGIFSDADQNEKNT